VNAHPQAHRHRKGDQLPRSLPATISESPSARLIVMAIASLTVRAKVDVLCPPCCALPLGRESSCDSRGILVSHVTPARCFRRHKRLRGIGVVEYHAEPLRIYSTTPWHALLLLDLPDFRRMSGIRNPLGDHIMSKNTPIPTARRFDVFVVEDYTKDGEEKAN
jgi:hypothetical protein